MHKRANAHTHRCFSHSSLTSFNDSPTANSHSTCMSSTISQYDVTDTNLRIIPDNSGITVTGGLMLTENTRGANIVE